jgi:hypothetical protein
MQLIRLAKLQYIRHATHSITSQYMYAYASTSGGARILVQGGQH